MGQKSYNSVQSPWNFSAQIYLLEKYSELFCNERFVLVDAPSQPYMLGTWQLVLVIVVPTLVVCLIAMAAYNVWQQKRATHTHLSHVDDSIEPPDHPILSGVSIRHMLEMTTSGSGSGSINLSKGRIWCRNAKTNALFVRIIGVTWF